MKNESKQETERKAEEAREKIKVPPATYQDVFEDIRDLVAQVRDDDKKNASSAHESNGERV